MPQRTDLSSLDRVVAALLAAVWIAAGLTVIAISVVSRRWLMLIPSAFAIWYGSLWVRVSLGGRRLPWPASLWPWARKRD
jgi:hypothetical protein